MGLLDWRDTRVQEKLARGMEKHGSGEHEWAWPPCEDACYVTTPAVSRCPLPDQRQWTVAGKKGVGLSSAYDAEAWGFVQSRLQARR